MSMARVKLRDGDREFEFDGPVEVIEAQLQAWQAWVERRTDSPLRCRPAGPAREAKASLEHMQGLPRIAPDFRVQRNLTLEGLVSLKEPRLDVERLLVIVYYGERYEERTVHGVQDLEMAWNRVFPDQDWRSEVLQEAVEQGFLESVEPGNVTLSYRGETFVRDGLA